jgi:hypothetical protein
MPAKEYLYCLADAYALSENTENKQKLENGFKEMCQEIKWDQQTIDDFRLKVKKIPRSLRSLAAKVILRSKHNTIEERIQPVLALIKSLPPESSFINFFILNGIKALKSTPINQRFTLFRSLIHCSNATADNFTQFLSVMKLNEDSEDFYKFIRFYCKKANKHRDHIHNPNIHSQLLKNIFDNVNKAHHAEIFRYIFSVYIGANLKNEFVYFDHNNLKSVINNLLPAINTEKRAEALNQTFFCIKQNDQERLYLSSFKVKKAICACIKDVDDMISYLTLLPEEQQTLCITDNIKLNPQCLNVCFNGLFPLPLKTFIHVLSLQKNLNLKLKMLNKKTKNLFVEKIKKENCDPTFFLASKLKYCLNQNKSTGIKEWLELFRKNPNNKEVTIYFNLIMELIKLLRPSFGPKTNTIWCKFQSILLEYLDIFGAAISTDKIKAAELKFTESLKEFNENFLNKKIHNSANFWKGPITYINAQKILTELIKAIDEKHNTAKNLPTATFG